MKRQRAKPVVPNCHKENDWQVESLNKYVFPSITWINWSSCLLLVHDKNQESIGNQCTSSVMFCSLCPLSVRQLIDRINLALTDQSIYPTRMHLLDLIQNDPQAFSFCMAAISPHLPLKKNTDQGVKEEPEKSSWLSTGYSQSLPWLCPKLREQHLSGSDSPIWFFFATATAVAKCMNHNS